MTEFGKGLNDLCLALLYRYNILGGEVPYAEQFGKSLCVDFGYRAASRDGKDLYASGVSKLVVTSESEVSMYAILC